jgi:hypothetical protein
MMDLGPISKMWQTLPDSWKQGWWKVIAEGGIFEGGLPDKNGGEDFTIFFMPSETAELLKKLIVAWNETIAEDGK